MRIQLPRLELYDIWQGRDIELVDVIGDVFWDAEEEIPVARNISFLLPEARRPGLRYQLSDLSKLHRGEVEDALCEAWRQAGGIFEVKAVGVAR